MNHKKETWLRLERTLCAMKDLCEGLSLMCGCENEKAHQFAMHGAMRMMSYELDFVYDFIAEECAEKLAE